MKRNGQIQEILENFKFEPIPVVIKLNTKEIL